MTDFEKSKKEIEDAFDKLHTVAHATIDHYLGKVERSLIEVLSKANAKAAHPAGKGSKDLPDVNQMVADLVRYRESRGESAAVWKEVGKRPGLERIVYSAWKSLPAEERTARAAGGKQNEVPNVPNTDGQRLIDGLFKTFKDNTPKGVWPEYKPDAEKKPDVE